MPIHYVCCVRLHLFCVPLTCHFYLCYHDCPCIVVLLPPNTFILFWRILWNQIWQQSNIYVLKLVYSHAGKLIWHWPYCLIWDLMSGQFHEFLFGWNSRRTRSHWSLQLHIHNIVVLVTRTVIPIQDLISKENISWQCIISFVCLSYFAMA